MPLFAIHALLLLATGTQGVPDTLNLDFETGAIGSPPPAWFVPSQCAIAGYVVEIVESTQQGEGRWARLKRSEVVAEAPKTFGNLMQSIDAASYRGKSLVFSGRLRAEGEASRAQFWVRVDRKDGVMGFFDNMSDRPVSSPEWTPFEIVAPVEQDAEVLNFGLMSFGGGEVGLDAVVLEVLDQPLVGCEPPRALEGRALENLIAFTKLYGYLRWFHPSDQAAAADWNELAIEGVRAVESAADEAELAARLQSFFAPVAPLLRVAASRQALEVAEAALRLDAFDASTRYTVWTHCGVGFGHENPVYWSKRVLHSASSTQDTGAQPSADRPVVYALSGGVQCAFPLALRVDSNGATAPAFAAGAAPVREPRTLRVRPSGDDRATRLADVVIAWNVFQHFYPYFDVVETDWPGALRDALSSAAFDAGAEPFARTLERLVARLHDGHGSVGHLSTFYMGQLPLAWDWIEGRLVITRVLSSASAELGVGDCVTEIDGVPAEQALRTAEEFISSATPQWARYCSLERLASGPPASRVELTVRSPEGLDRKVVLARIAVASESDLEALHEPRPAVTAELSPGIAYVDLDRVTESEFEAFLPTLAASRGIVFDLRGYPRRISPVFLQHLTDQSLTSPHWKKPLVSLPDREGWKFDDSGRWDLPPLEPRLTAKLAFVTDGRAISYAESCLAIVAHYRLAEIVGGATAGTNGNINPFELPGGYHLSWTGMRVEKHDGSRHHGVGVSPTVPVQRTLRGVLEGRDELLDAAVERVSRE